MSKTIELAEQSLQLGKELALAQKEKTVFPQAIVMAAEYYQHLRVLIKTGKLPADYLEKHAASLKAEVDRL